MGQDASDSGFFRRRGKYNKSPQVTLKLRRACHVGSGRDHCITDGLLPEHANPLVASYVV